MLAPGVLRLKTVLYLDELLLTNFAIGAALLLAAGFLAAQRCCGLRLCAGALAAALSSLTLLLPQLPPGVALALKAATGAGTVVAAYGVAGRRPFFRLCAWYLLLNFLLCGTAVLPGVQANNLSICLPLTPGRLLICCGGVCAAVYGVTLCFGHSNAPSFDAELVLRSGERIQVRAFYDTGFSVQEPLGATAVVLVQYRPVRSKLPDVLRSFLDGYFSAGDLVPPPELALRLIPCRTIAGRCLLPAVPAALCTRTASAEGILAAFCDTDDPAWTALFGAEVAQLIGK